MTVGRVTSFYLQQKGPRDVAKEEFALIIELQIQLKRGFQTCWTNTL